MNNAYPDKRLVPYQRTTVPMSTVIKALAAMDIPAAVKRSAYVVFRNESAGGTSGICFNFGGVQADGIRWPAQYDSLITGVVKKVENGTGQVRLFCAFKDLPSFLMFLTSRLQGRGLYVGGYAHLIAKMEIHTPTDLARAYKKDWVTGKKDAEPSTETVKNFLSMYKQAVDYFPA